MTVYYIHGNFVVVWNSSPHLQPLHGFEEAEYAEFEPLPRIPHPEQVDLSYPQLKSEETQ